MRMKRFMMAGCGYIAEKHYAAIRALDGDVAVITDPNDSVGRIDSFFPNALYYQNFEEAYDYVLAHNDRASTVPIEFLTVCSPNYLHKSHVSLGLRGGLNVVCEKPLVKTKADLDYLLDVEQANPGSAYCILQLRFHSKLKELKDYCEALRRTGRREQLELTYITPRGDWFFSSWKSNKNQSFGLPYNIGIHFFDFLTCCFGSVCDLDVEYCSQETWKGVLHFEHLSVSWLLSVSTEYLYKSDSIANRSIQGKDLGRIDLTENFTDLHLRSYQEIFNGNGFGMREAMDGIVLAESVMSIGKR